MKRKLSLILALVLMLSTLFSVNVFAKANLPTISQSKPLTTYTYNSSGKVYAYTSSNLKTKTGGYIACSTDECKIIEISGNAVKVIYPVSNGTKTAWFSREAFTYRNLASDAADSSFTAQTTAATYKWKGKTSTFGSVAKGDKCYLLRGNENSDWVQIIYPVSKGHKMGWVKGADYAKMIGATPTPEPEPETTTSDWQWPMNDYQVNQSWAASNPKRGGYHAAIDIDHKNYKGADKNIYAAANGTVIYKNYTNGNGNHIILSHKIGNTTVKTLYSHLSSFDGCPAVGKTVKKGQKIGVIGNSGNSTGTHLHFAIFQGNSTDPFGYYTKKVNDNKGTRVNGSKTYTYYNPSYVIKYNKLP